MWKLPWKIPNTQSKTEQKQILLPSHIRKTAQNRHWSHGKEQRIQVRIHPTAAAVLWQKHYNLSCGSDKISNQSKWNQERSRVTQSSKVQFRVVGRNSNVSVTWLITLCPSEERKEKGERNADIQFSFSFFSSPGNQPMELCHPHLEWGFLPHWTLWKIPHRHSRKFVS